MVPSSVTLHNFRSFGRPDGVRLELRPLTLLYGTNNCGKSSIARSLPLLADSIGHDSLDALNVEGRLKPFDLDFDSLRWKGGKKTNDRTIQLSLRWEDTKIRGVEWTLWEEPDWHRIVVKSFLVRGAEPAPLFSADWMMTPGEEAERALSYDVVRDGGRRTRQRIVFRGLLPEVGPGASDPALDEVQRRLSGFSDSVLWLHSLRQASARFTQRPQNVRWSLEPDGRDASSLLAAEDDLLADVSSWYRTHLGCELLIQESRKGAMRATLRRRTPADFDIDLIDTGEGVSQCLPVVTALAMARRHRERGGPSLVILEEPEAHLHPDLQRALAERACEVVRTARPKLVIETHSEHVLLTARLQVVKGLLKPEDVVVYWVSQLRDGNSIADRIELDDDGRFNGNWPPGTFRQDVSLAADIQDELDQRGP